MYVPLLRGYQPDTTLNDQYMEASFFGRQPAMESTGPLFLFWQRSLKACGTTIHHTTRVHFASNPAHGSFGHIIFARSGSNWQADGILLKAGEAMMGMTRDCLTVIITHPAKREVLVLHIGRPQLQHPPQQVPKATNVLTHALAWLRELWGALDEATVLVAGGICAAHFRHDQPDARKHLEAFRELGAVTDEAAGTIDLRVAVTHYLTQAGIRDTAIECDATCTHGTDGWSSKRVHEAGMPGKGGQNLCIVVNKFSTKER